MSNLLFSDFDIPRNAPYISPLAAFDEDLHQWNLIGGNRYNYGQFNVAATTNSIRFDLGSAATKSCNHLIIARCDILKAAGLTTVTLAGGSDGVTFGTTAHTNASMSSATLYGPKSDDYIIEFTATTALRWWRMSYGGSSSKFCHSKISFGTAFDLGKDIESFDIDKIPANEASWDSDSGAKYLNRVGDELYKFRFLWKGITAAKTKTFLDTIGKYGYKYPFFMYTASAGGEHRMLDGMRVVHVILTSARVDYVYSDYANIEIEVIEVLG